MNDYRSTFSDKTWHRRWQHYSAKIFSMPFYKILCKKTYSLKNTRSGWCKMSGLAFIAAMNCCNCTSCCLGIPDIVDRPYFCGMTKSNKRLFLLLLRKQIMRRKKCFTACFEVVSSYVIAELFWRKNSIYSLKMPIWANKCFEKSKLITIFVVIG